MTEKSRKYLIPLILITSLFFLWALAHNLNDILIRQFQKALDLNRGQAGFIQFAFYLGLFHHGYSGRVDHEKIRV